jgi:hypothetical protein
MVIGTGKYEEVSLREKPAPVPLHYTTTTTTAAATATVHDEPWPQFYRFLII